MVFAGGPVEAAAADKEVATMSEANKALVVEFVEAFWNRGELSAADDLMAADATVYLPTGEIGGPEALKAMNREWRSAFPDWTSTMEEIVSEGDRVVERWTGRGTHRGELRAFAPTGTNVTAPGVVFYRIVEGKIIEFRGQFDMAAVMQQIGANEVATPEAR
jgi:steroid delta-isomerase-like uncharacterized protein